MTPKVQRVLIGLPAFNEEIAIERLFAKIAQLASSLPQLLTVVVYNDGSTDRTAEVTVEWQSRLPIVLLGLTENRGLGAGLGALVQYAAANGQSGGVLAVMDCDDTHDPAQIPDMIAEIEAGNDIVIASRFRPGATAVGIPLLRRMTARGAMVLLKLIQPIAGVRDYTCGYRLYRVELLQTAVGRFGMRLVSERGFACMVELLLKLNIFRPRIVEIPLRLRYDRKPTPSKMAVGSYISRLLRLVTVWRLRGFDIDRAG